MTERTIIIPLLQSDRPVAPKPVDARDNLLAEIAKGKELKVCFIILLIKVLNKLERKR